MRPMYEAKRKYMTFYDEIIDIEIIITSYLSARVIPHAEYSQNWSSTITQYIRKEKVDIVVREVIVSTYFVIKDGYYALFFLIM